MLPDWPIPKRAIFKVIRRLVRERARGMSIVGEIPYQPVFEGHARSIRMADGVVDQSDFRVASGEANVPLEAIKSGRLEDVLDALMPVSNGIGAAMAKSMYQTIEAGVKSVGNELDAGGKPMTAELILDGFEKVLVDFDGNEQPLWPTVVMHPLLSNHLQAELARLESEPALAQRFAEMTDRKREEWRAREASRVLVG